MTKGPLPVEKRWNLDVFDVSLDQYQREHGTVKAHITPDMVGIDPVPGHRLMRDLVQSDSAQRINTTCSCGMPFAVILSQKGVANGYTRTNWHEHVEAATADVDERHVIGSIRKKSGEQTISVIPYRHREVDLYAAKSERYADWLKRNVGWVKWLVVGDLRNDQGALMSKSILSSGQSKQKALEWAVRHIEKADRAGETVTRIHTGFLLPDQVATPATVLADLISEAHQASTIDQMDSVLERLHEVLAAVPGLTQMKDQLQAKRLAALTGPRNRMEGA